MSGIEKRYIPTKYGQIHARLSPENGKPILILLHQTASSSAMFEALFPYLGDDFWLIAPDTPGFGNSAVLEGQPTVALYALALWEAVDQLTDQSCFLFGHHTGASIGVEMALKRPSRVKKLALSGPPLLTGAQVDALKKGLQPIRPDENGAFLQSTWQRLQKKGIELPLELILRETILTLKAGESYPLAYQAVFEHPFAEQISQLTCPTLLMAGEYDSLFSSLEPTFACLPDNIESEMHIFPNAGSYICDRQPGQVAKLMHQFFIKK